MAGSCVGYLWYNTPPAEIFMGDTGSLSTGAALGTIAVLLKKGIITDNSWRSLCLGGYFSNNSNLIF